MYRALFFCAATLLIGMSACTQRLVCPAYQSSFIYDKAAQKEKFMYYNESTTSPREIMASNGKTFTLPPRDSSWSKSSVMPGPSLPYERKRKKGKYLLLPEKTYKKALRSLRTVEMKPVYPKKQDSLDIASALDSAARSITDTLTYSRTSDTTQQVREEYAITKTKEKYNMDQDIYMWYFRDLLVLPDVRAAMADEREAQSSKAKAEKKAKKGFFRNLFKKKDKSDSTANLTQTEEENSQGSKKKGSGLRGLFKKKDKKVKPKDPVEAEDAPAKKEDEDDGF